jgi:hypothetical protein
VQSLTDPETIEIASQLLSEACESNRHRDAEILQGVDGEKEHAEDVLGWVEKLTENPSLALRLAALFHDIDRVVTPGVGGGFKGDRRSREYLEYKKAHARRSADYIYPRLLKRGVDQQVVERARFLIIHHDDTGSEVESFQDNELDYLVAADSLALFTTTGPRLYERDGEKRVKDKIRFMIEKMPAFAKKFLVSQKIDNELFNKLKDEVLSELES